MSIRLLGMVLCRVGLLACRFTPATPKKIQTTKFLI